MKNENKENDLRKLWEACECRVFMEWDKISKADSRVSQIGVIGRAIAPAGGIENFTGFGNVRRSEFYHSNLLQCQKQFTVSIQGRKN